MAVAYAAANVAPGSRSALPLVAPATTLVRECVPGRAGSLGGIEHRVRARVGGAAALVHRPCTPRLLDLGALAHQALVAAARRRAPVARRHLQPLLVPSLAGARVARGRRGP